MKKSTILLVSLFTAATSAAFIYFLIYNMPTANDTISSTDSSKHATQETVKPPLALISSEEKVYFKLIALGFEYPDSSNENLIVKWTKSRVGLNLNGIITESDRLCVSETLQDFNELSTEIHITLTSDSKADIQIFFQPEQEFKSTLPQYTPKNRGFFYTNWSGDKKIQKATILIDSTSEISQAERCHLIREEITQSTGLAVDSALYLDSIFQSAWTETTSYSDIDKAVIRILYGGYGITPGDDSSKIDSKIEAVLK